MDYKHQLTKPVNAGNPGPRQYDHDIYSPRYQGKADGCQWENFQRKRRIFYQPALGYNRSRTAVEAFGKNIEYGDPAKQAQGVIRLPG